MHTLSDIARALNRSPVYLHGLQVRFELPASKGASYSEPYLAFLRTITRLRTLNVAEDTLLELWTLEKKLLVLLHADSTGSPTWFLDACGRTDHPHRRLLLTNYDMGAALPSNTVQLGLDFAERMPEFFEGQEMGEDALRVLAECLKVSGRIHAAIRAEIPNVRAAASWAVKQGRRAVPLAPSSSRKTSKRRKSRPRGQP